MKAAAWLTALVLALSAGIHFLHAFQVKRSAGALLYQAERLEKNPIKAAQYLARYLALKPDDDDIRVKYGMLLSQQDWDEKAQSTALLNLDQVLRRQPNREEVRRRVAQLALRLERYEQARENLENLLRQHPHDVQLELALGLAEEGLDNHSKAAVWFRQVIGHDPHQVQAYVELARLFREHAASFKGERLRPEISCAVTVAPLAPFPCSLPWALLPQSSRKRPPLADQVMDDLVGNNQKSILAYLKRALYRKNFKLAHGDKDLEMARQLARKRIPKPKPNEDNDALLARDPEWALLRPSVIDVFLTSALCANDRKDYDLARDYLNQTIQLDPNYLLPHLVLAQVEIRAGRFDNAAQCLQQCLPLAERGAPETMFLVANLLLDARDPVTVESDLLPKLEKTTLPGEQVQFLNARLLMMEEKWSDACSLLEHIRPMLAPENQLVAQFDSTKIFASDRQLAVQAGVLLGRCYQELGEPDLQLLACQLALESDDSNTPARLGLASALVAIGHTDEAVDEYRLLQRDVPEARLALARLLIQRNLHSPRKQRDGWRNRREIDLILQEAARLKPVPVEVPLLQAEVLIAHGQPAAAARLLEAARAAQPRQVQLWAALADVACFKTTDKPQWNILGMVQGWGILTKARAQVGDSVKMRLVLAQYAARYFGPKARVVLAELMRDARKFSDADQIQLLRGLAAVATRIGAADDAQRFWQVVANRRPKDLHSRLVLFDLALQPGHEKTLAGAIAEIEVLDGKEGALACYCRAARLILLAKRGGDRQELAAARKDLEKAANRRDRWSRVAVLQAELEELEDNPEAAIVAYQQAITLGDRRLDIVRRLVELLRERHRFPEATAVIQKTLAETEADGSLVRLGAEVSVDLEDYPSALELARRAVPTDSTDYKDHVWLGQICWYSHDLPEAEKELLRGVQLAKQVPQSWLALIQFYGSTGQMDKARAYLQEAQAAMPSSELLGVLAPGYALLGQLEQARKEYLRAVAAHPGKIPVLRAAAEFSLQHQQYGEAEPLLRKLLTACSGRSQAELILTRRYLALCLVMSAKPGHYKEAEELVENNLNLNARSADDQQAMAHVLAAQPDRRREAIEAFEILHKRRPLPAADRFRLAQLYEADGQWPKAKQFLRGLVANEKDNAVYLAYYASRLVKLDSKKQALAILAAYAPNRLDDLERVARQLMDLKETQVAEQMLRQYVSQSRDPRTVLSLAGFLAANGRWKAALDLCDQAWETCPAEQVCELTLLILHSGPRDKRQLQRMERRLTEAIKKDSDSAALLLALANLRDCEGNYEEAKTQYRRVLDKDPRQIGALNNLAWLLALKDGQGKEALRLIDRAILLAGADPQPGLLDTRAVVLITLEKADEAVQELDRSIAANPSADKYFHLAWAQRALGNSNASKAALAEAQKKGLKLRDLHPLERPIYRQLAQQRGR